MNKDRGEQFYYTIACRYIIIIMIIIWRSASKRESASVGKSKFDNADDCGLKLDSNRYGP